MKSVIAIFLALLMAGCARAQPTPALEQAPAKAATSTAAQSEEIAPIVVGAVATGAAAIGVGLALREPHLAIAGAGTAVGALALQRFLPWIPWLIAAAACYMAIRWAVKHHIGSTIWAKEKASLAKAGSVLDALKDRLK